jgi:hypothetical protein
MALLIISNAQAESCGKPPEITNTNGDQYTGYFENRYGEQNIFVYDYKEKKGLLYCGDAGWEEPSEVINGIPQGLGLSPEEKVWLASCWTAAVTENTTH